MCVRRCEGNRHRGEEDEAKCQKSRTKCHFAELSCCDASWVTMGTFKASKRTRISDCTVCSFCNQIFRLIGLETLESCQRGRWGTATRLARERPIRQFKQQLAASTQSPPRRSFVSAFICSLPRLLHPSSAPRKSTKLQTFICQFIFMR